MLASYTQKCCVTYFARPRRRKLIRLIFLIISPAQEIPVQLLFAPHVIVPLTPLALNPVLQVTAAVLKNRVVISGDLSNTEAAFTTIG